MRVSIFTPTHDTRYLRDAYESIKDQPFYEWVIVYNNGAVPVGFDDRRVKAVRWNDEGNGVGFFKRLACDHCSGDILLELDHDDLLMPTAIEEVVKAFQKNPSAGFVFSNSVPINMDWTRRERYDASFGWQYRDFNYNGQTYDEVISFPAIPASVSRIWFAPDHVRAFRKDVYNAAGGYNPDLIILDDQDLMSRLFTKADFYHIDKPLYIYRVHGENAWLRYNKEIQDGVYPIYDKYIEPMALAWAKRSGLKSFDLGGRIATDDRYQSVDLKDADVVADLNARWPMDDNSVGVIRAFDVFEHLHSPLFTMKELYRVLAPGGYAFIQIPSTDGRGAFQDPTHVSFWNENSFLYYTNSKWARYIDTPVRFQAMKLCTSEKDDYGVCWVFAHLIKLDNSIKIPGRVDI